MSLEMKSFLQLLYSLAKQYISWYEKEMKQKQNGSIMPVTK